MFCKIGNKHYFVWFTGRRPFKQLPTDELFADALLETLQLAFDNMVPRFVMEDLNTPEYSRVLDLWNNKVRDYNGYLRIMEAKQEARGAYVSAVWYIATNEETQCISIEKLNFNAKTSCLTCTFDNCF